MAHILVIIGGKYCLYLVLLIGGVKDTDKPLVPELCTLRLRVLLKSQKIINSRSVNVKCNFNHYFVWVQNLVSHINSSLWIEGDSEQGAWESIST